MYKFSESARKAVFISLSLLCASVNAAPDKVEKHGSWFYQCKTVNKVEACALRHVQLFKDKTPALTLAIAYSKSEDRLNLHYKAPLGVYLPDGLRFQVDSRKEYTGQYMDCQKTGCAGVVGLGDDQVWAMKAGKKMNVKFSYQRGKKTTALVVPLNGVSEGLNKIRQPVKVGGKAKNKKPKTKQKAAEQKAAEQKAAEQKAAEQRAAEQRAAEQRAAEQRAAEQRAAEQRAAEQRAAEQRAAEQEEASSGLANWLGDLFSGDKQSADEAGGSEDAGPNAVE